MRNLLLALSICSAPAALTAQWRAALTFGTSATHGDARDDLSPAHPEIRAEGPATIALGIARDAGPWRVGIAVHRVNAGVAEVSASTAVTTRDALRAWGGALEVGHRLLGRLPGPTLHALVGAGIDRWAFQLDDGAPRWRTTGRGALEAAMPISAAWRAVIRGQATVGPSVFDEAELPDGFVQRTAIRTGVFFGIARRF